MDQDYPDSQPGSPSSDDYDAEYPYVPEQPYVPRQNDTTQAVPAPEQADQIDATHPAYGPAGEYPTGPESETGRDLPAYAQPGTYQAYPPHTVYPPYAGPPLPAAPLPETPRKRTKLWITLGAVGVLVVAAVLLSVFVLLPILSNSPVKATAQKACDALKAENFRALYELYTNEMQQQINQTTILGIPVDENAYTIVMATQVALADGIKDCQVSDVQTSDNTAKITITYGNSYAETDPVTVVQENGTWRIQFGSPLTNP
jgi:hypothetical protein